MPAAGSSSEPASLPAPGGIAPLLLQWYRLNCRKLPWRGDPDPYAVWVSEVMLQQTRVETVISYYERWMRLFPSVADLAAAPLQQVLKAWEGLGYYGRARNLHRAAREVMAGHGGVIPSQRSALERLPGIGPYTAGAIASIAYRQDEALLDGNLRRVYSRLFNIVEPLGTPASERLLWQAAREVLPAGKAGDFNQAVMDLGALVCTPRQPQCGACPLAQLCQARRADTVAQRPVPKLRPAVPHHTVTAAVILHRGRVLITRRPQDGLLGGMWEFPGGKLQPGEALDSCLMRELCEELGIQVSVGEPFGVYRHAYTHFRITLHAFRCTLKGGEPQPLQADEVLWVKPGQLVEFPMGKVDRLIAGRLAGAA